MEYEHFLKNKKIIVVGGSSGIGLAVAQKSLYAGAEVIIAARTVAKLATVARRLGNGVHTEALDASDENAVVRFFECMGPFDHLVIAIKPTLPEGSALLGDAGIARLAFDVKFWGQYYLAKHAARHIRKSGSITLTSGVASKRAYKGYVMIGVINAATEALCSALAAEIAPIRINTVCPGFVDAEPVNSERGQLVRALAPGMPLNRLAEADEIADAYLYLMKNTYSTGTTMVVDGGVSC